MQIENGKKAARKRKIWPLTALMLLLAVILATFIQVYLTDEKEKVEPQVNKVSGTDYSASKEIEEALVRLQDNPELPQVITDINTVDKKVALCFEGATDEAVVLQIKEYLKAHDMEATFFLSAVEVAESESAVEELLKENFAVENYTLYGTPHMEKKTKEELVTDFCRAGAVYQDKLSKTPVLLKCNATEYTDDVLKAAGACGFESIVYPTKYLNYKSFFSEEMAKNFVAGLGQGRLISVKLDGYLDELEYEEERVELDPAKDKKPKLELHDLDEEELTETEMLLRGVDWLLTYLDVYDYETVPLTEFPAQDLGDLVLKYNEMEELYTEQMAEAVTTVHTTDREMAFTFRGIGDEEELSGLLATLKEINAGATFFVTGKELDRYEDRVRMIIDAGYEIGNGGYSGKNMTEMSFGEICEDIYKNDLLLERLGVKTDLFMPPYGAVSDAVRMAVTAMEKKLILYSMAPARMEYVEKGYDIQTSVKKYFPVSKEVLCRGDILYFNMNVYEDSTSLAALVKEVYDRKILPTRYGQRKGCMLQVTSVSVLMDHMWEYPASTDATYGMIKKNGNAKLAFETAVSERYIGTPWQQFNGFSDSELEIIDNVGRIDTGDSNTAFLTFDDWGDERTVGRLLYVLRKHNIKASFFVKTQYVEDDSSANLLRAIAEEGHDVCSHTDTHMTINVGAADVGRLQNDLVTANHKLSRITGNTGAMKSFFRPPTLEINRVGIETVFDAGYHWIVCGEMSTGDYNATSPADVFDILKNGVVNDDLSITPIQKGTIVVMHMNPTALHTPQGLDRYLNWVEELPEGDPNKFHFAKLSEYLK